MAVGRPIGHEMGAVVSYNSGYFLDIDGPTSVATSNGLGQRNPLGFRQRDDNGNEYIYLGGVASLAQGDFVVFNMPAASSPFLPVRLVSTPLTGPVAVAMNAIVASCFGWFQIYGLTPTFTNIGTDASGDGKALYQSATAGRASTTAAATKAIFGAWAVGNPASNAGTAFINFPFSVGSSTL